MAVSGCASLSRDTLHPVTQRVWLFQSVRAGHGQRMVPEDAKSGARGPDRGGLRPTLPSAGAPGDPVGPRHHPLLRQVQQVH